VFPQLAKLADTDRFAACAQAADALSAALPGATVRSAVLLKGVPTIVGSTRTAALVTASGNPALATGGSGDLLAGFTGAFIARGLRVAEAGALAAHVLGRAAELAAAQLTVRGTRPMDVLAVLPELWRAWAEPPVPSPPVVLELAPPQVT
jgi:NAD(P)H-hydrate epimerase